MSQPDCIYSHLYLIHLEYARIHNSGIFAGFSWKKTSSWTYALPPFFFEYRIMIDESKP